MKTKGFTLIELLIVITIIGILAVAFLPTLLGAPAKSRDETRKSDLAKIQKVLIDGDLEGMQYPTGVHCVTPGSVFDAYIPKMGGSLIVDPQENNKIVYCSDAGYYFYMSDPNGDFGAFTTDPGTYKFVLSAQVENLEAANTRCSAMRRGVIYPPNPTNPDSWCYAIFMN